MYVWACMCNTNIVIRKINREIIYIIMILNYLSWGDLETSQRRLVRGQRREYICMCVHACVIRKIKRDYIIIIYHAMCNKEDKETDI